MSEILCGLCHQSIQPGDPVHRCPSCHAPTHAECWEENGGCGTYGCPKAPELAKQSSVSSPTWWGQDQKQCPVCGKEIKAAALRCRHCEAQFETAAPLTPEEYQQKLEIKDSKGRSESWSVVLFIAGVIPCTSPLALLVGGCVMWFNRERVKYMRPLHKILAQLGLALSALWLLLALLIWAFSRHGA